jgi:hypothetical protein
VFRAQVPEEPVQGQEKVLQSPEVIRAIQMAHPEHLKDRDREWELDRVHQGLVLVYQVGK